MSELKPQPSPWVDAPVGAFGIGAGIVAAGLSVSEAVPGWLAVFIGMVFGFFAQVAVNNLLYSVSERARRRMLPTVGVGTRGNVVVIRVGYERYQPNNYREAEMSPDGAMGLARSLVEASLELDKDSEHRIELH